MKQNDHFPIDGEAKTGAETEAEIRNRREPEAPDCADQMSPAPLGTEGETCIIEVADGLVSLPKVFMNQYRLSLYRYLRNRLEDGTLEGMTGFRFEARKITRQVCDFTDFEQWRIERGLFHIDVHVKLKQQAGEGSPEWKGIIAVTGYFENGLQCEIEGIYDERNAPDRSGCMRLSPFLIPYMSNQEMEEIAERLLNERLPDAVMNPKRGNGEKLAAACGLKVMYLTLLNEHTTESIVFFEKGELEILTGDISPEYGTRTEIQTATIPAGTIVVNIARREKEYADNCILHECIHYEFHNLFFELQQLVSSDINRIKTRKQKIRAGEKISDPLYWMEKQAKRGADCLEVTERWLREQIGREIKRDPQYQHMGELYEWIGMRIYARHRIPNFLIRKRMIQTGHIEAKGSMNRVDGRRIAPFAFERSSLERAEETFVIRQDEVIALERENKAFQEITASGKFVYADGRYVLNTPKCVTEIQVNGRPERMLTPWANAHVDRCCLRFQQIYVQVRPGEYVFGRMNCDENYIRRTLFFLRGQTAGEEIIDEGPAILKYQNDMPASFRECVKKLMKQTGFTYEKMAEALNVEVNTFAKWMSGQRKMPVSIDLVVVICLVLETPDWVSFTLLNRAGLALNEKDNRDAAIKQILRARWDEGIEKANQYLKQRGYEALSI